MKFCYDNCKHLNITEKEQTQYKNTFPHICKKYEERVFHAQFHPNLIRLKECNYKQ